MLRKLLTIGLPLALPILLYILHVAVARKRGTMQRAPTLSETPWALLLGSGVALMAVSLIAWRLLVAEVAEPGQAIRSDRYEDGKLVPGEIEQPE